MPSTMSTAPPASLCALLALATSSVRGQEWRVVGDPFVAATVAVFDEVRGRLVGVGAAAETREWDGSRWLHRPVGLLPQRPKTMAYDSTRGVVVALVDRWTNLFMTEVYEFDGNRWQQRVTATGPQVFLHGEAVFDSARDRTVFVCGGSTVPAVQTWEWDGATWTLRNVVGPSRRIAAAMAFDRARGRTVLFGGTDPMFILNPPLGDTWEWDGVVWMQRTPPVAPSARSGASMTFDTARGVSVLYGGGATPDTWEYDGNTWTPWPQAGPHGRGRVVYDSHRDRTVLIGGGVTSNSQDLWEWDGAAWSQQFATMLPIENVTPGTAYSITRDRLVLFGDLVAGSNSARTWEWDGASWLLRAPPTSPPRRSQHGMWSDGNDVFLFGGRVSSTQFLDDTWRFDGTTWSPVASAQRPPGREYPAVAFDPTTGGALLFGGGTGPGTAFGDTWQLTAAGWNQVATPVAPTARSGAAMVGDLARGNVLLWGGADMVVGARADTWSWNGTGWQQLTPANAPAPDAFVSMAFEPVTGLVVLLAQPAVIGAKLDTWVWDGVDWSQLVIPAVALPLWPSVSAAPGRVRLFDGESLYELALQSPRADSYGAACPATLQLRADDWPRPGTDLTLSSSGHLAAAPALLGVGLQQSATPVAGCTLLVQPRVSLFTTTDGFGNGRWPLPIPAASTLVGLRVFAQAFGLRSGGLEATQGIELTVGQ